jgi:hypothetical protein
VTGDGSLDAVVFFEGRRDALKQAAATGGGRAVVASIAEYGSFAERLVLYTLARQVLVIGQDASAGLDAAIDVADAGVDEVEDLLAEAEDEGQRRHLLRALHMLNFNLAADLADCWPDDDAPRERRHFERGLRAAEALLAPIFDGAATPHVLANDWWVKGMHELSLGRLGPSRQSFREALDHAVEAADREGVPVAGPNTTLQALLTEGYLAISEAASGPEDLTVARLRYASAAEALESRSSGAEEGREAAYFLAQLEKVRGNYAATM